MLAVTERFSGPAVNSVIISDQSLASIAGDWLPADLSYDEFRNCFDEIRPGLEFTDHLMFETELRSADGGRRRFSDLNEAAVSAGAGAADG